MAPVKDNYPAGFQRAKLQIENGEEIADTVIEKLRRELLIERELGGGAKDLI